MGARSNATARTYPYEVMSGVVIAFAPSFLESEIQKYMPKIAEDEGVLVDRVLEEWKQFKVLIRFYQPSPSKQPVSSADPKKMDYVHVLKISDDRWTRVMSVLPPCSTWPIRPYRNSTRVFKEPEKRAIRSSWGSTKTIPSKSCKTRYS